MPPTSAPVPRGLFGETLFGYRMLSLLSVVASGLLLFVLVRSIAGALPALIAQAAYLFSPLHWRTLPAIPEPPMVAFTLLGVVLLFTGGRRWSAYASGVAFVCALFIKPTCLPMVLAAALALAYAREWRRLADLAVAGIVATVLGRGGVSRTAFSWRSSCSSSTASAPERRASGPSIWVSRTCDGWPGSKRRGSSPASFKDFLRFAANVPIGLFVASLLALPIWVLGCARSRTALRAFALLWPASFFYVNFVALDFVTPRYFTPFLAFSAFLLAGWVWLAQRWVPVTAVAVVGAAAAILLATTVRPALKEHRRAGLGRLPDRERGSRGLVLDHPRRDGGEPGCGRNRPSPEGSARPC
jgi:membrane protein implicated in regulation of membrane protease activity